MSFAKILSRFINRHRRAADQARVKARDLAAELEQAEARLERRADALTDGARALLEAAVEDSRAAKDAASTAQALRLIAG